MATRRAEGSEEATEARETLAERRFLHQVEARETEPRLGLRFRVVQDRGRPSSQATDGDR